MKENKILGIALMIWGIMFAIYKLFFPTSLYAFLGNEYFQYSKEQIEQYKIGLQNLISIIEIAFIIVLVVLFIFAIINLRKKNIKFFTISKNRMATSVMLILFALIFHISGLVLISIIFTFVSGILLILYKE